jgi:hypothetical protein
MEDVLLPKSFSCSTPSSEEEEERETVIVTIPPPPPPPAKNRVYDARWAAAALIFLAVLMCVSVILWYIFTNNS